MYVQSKPAEPPNVPYPTPIQVGDSIELRFRKIMDLMAYIRKGLELAENTARAYQTTKDAELKQVVAQNYWRQIQDIEEKWILAANEINNLAAMGLEGKKLASVILIAEWSHGIQNPNERHRKFVEGLLFEIDKEALKKLWGGR
jgi:hypothetical protein